MRDVQLQLLRDENMTNKNKRASEEKKKSEGSTKVQRTSGNSNSSKKVTWISSMCSIIFRKKKLPEQKMVHAVDFVKMTFPHSGVFWRETTWLLNPKSRRTREAYLSLVVSEDFILLLL